MYSEMFFALSKRSQSPYVLALLFTHDYSHPRLYFHSCTDLAVPWSCRLSHSTTTPLTGTAEMFSVRDVTVSSEGK